MNHTRWWKTQSQSHLFICPAPHFSFIYSYTLLRHDLCCIMESVFVHLSLNVFIVWMLKVLLFHVFTKFTRKIEWTSQQCHSVCVTSVQLVNICLFYTLYSHHLLKLVTVTIKGVTLKILLIMQYIINTDASIVNRF